MKHGVSLCLQRRYEPGAFAQQFGGDVVDVGEGFESRRWRGGAAADAGGRQGWHAALVRRRLWRGPAVFFRRAGEQLADFARLHAVDGFGDELFVFHRLDVIALDAVEYLGEGAQF